MLRNIYYSNLIKKNRPKLIEINKSLDNKQLDNKPLDNKPLDINIDHSKSIIYNKIINYLKTDLDKCGIIYYNFNTKEKICINENKDFRAGCTFYLGLYIYIYDQVKKGNIDLNSKIMYNNTNYQEGSGILRYKINTILRDPLPVHSLLKIMIVESDCIAASMIYSAYGGATLIRQKIRDMVNYEKSNLIENYTTPEIEFRLLKKIYDNKNEYLDFIELLKNTSPPHNRLKKYIPPKIISHKAGVYMRAVNDIGIVFTKNPYIIIFYSENLSNAFEKIAQLSKIIYEEHI